MKLELLTNATVVDDAIRFLASHAASIERVDSSKLMIKDNEVSSRNSDKGSEEGCSKEQLLTKTNNFVF
jgi:hypothetical protein